MINSFSRYGRSSTALPSVGGKTFFVSSDSEILVRFRAMFAPDEEGVVRVYSSLASLLATDAIQATRGDKVMIAEHHAETISAAAGIDVDLAGVEIIGLGDGDARPVFTFGTSTSASFDITGAGVKVRNIIGLAGIDGLTKPFNVTGNGCELDITWKDASSTVEAATAVRLDTADNVKLDLVYKGFTAGNAAVRPVAIDDCDNVRINIDGYGVVSTAWANMVDVASTNVHVTGRLYTSGVTDFSRNVVDTVTGSTWTASILDASAGSLIVGSNVAAFADADPSAVTAALATLQAEVSGAAGIVSFPASAAPGNGVSLAEVIRAIYDNVSGVDGTTNVLGANDADNGFDSSTVVANKDGSVVERLEALMDPLGGYDPILGFRVTKTSNLADGAGTDDLFTVTGRCLITHLSGEVTTVVGGAATLKLSDVTNTVDLCAATTIDTDAVGTMYALPGLSAQILNGTGGTPVIGSVPNMTVPSSGAGQIIGNVQAPLTIAQVLDAADTGAIAWVLYYKPLTAASSIVAAA